MHDHLQSLLNYEVNMRSKSRSMSVARPVNCTTLAIGLTKRLAMLWL